MCAMEQAQSGEISLPAASAPGARPGHLAPGRGRAQRGSRSGRAAAGARDRLARLIDTAEMYGDGGAEERGRRGDRRSAARAATAARASCSSSARCCRSNASARGVLAACERSLRRLQLDTHRPVPAALARPRTRWRQTVAASRQLQRARLDSRTGASATSTSTTCASSAQCPAARPARPTRSTTRWASAASSSTCCRGSASRQMPLMAYSPIDQGALASRRRRLRALAERAWPTPAQLALAWAAARRRRDADSQGGAASVHLRDNLAAAAVAATERHDLAALDRAVPAAAARTAAGDELSSRHGASPTRQVPSAR